MKLIDKSCLWYKCDEKGYFLLEALVLGAILIALAAGLLSYAKTETLRWQDACRLQAIFLAQEQLATLEEEAMHGSLKPGSVKWLGDDSDLTRSDVLFAVQTDVKPTDREYNVKVTVSWQKGSKDGSVVLQRVVCPHEKK